MFIFPLSLNFSATALVGQAIGKGNAKEAKRYAVLMQIIGQIGTIVIVLAVFLNREAIARFFTNIDALIEIAMKVFIF